MKKLLYIIGFLMFSSSVVQPMITLGQEEDPMACGGEGQFSCEEADVPFSTARLFSKLLEATGADPNADWSTSFGLGEGDEEDVGQDLYLAIYSKTEVQPLRQATKDTAGKYGLEEQEMIRIINGNYNVIAEKKPGLTQEELQLKVGEIQQEYEFRKEISQLKANVRAQVETSEIFANGDVGDSGFDLINDLEIIEELLFLHTNPIDIGKSYTSAFNDGLAQTGQAGGTQQNLTGPEGTLGPGQVGQTLTEGEPSETGMINGEFSSDTSVNPNFCFANEAFEEALNTFEEKSESDPNFKDGSAGQPLQDETIGQTQQEVTSADFLPAQPDPDFSALEPASADNWLQDAPCNDVFCLRVNFVEKPATSSYANSDNCIACHAEKINDVLKTVITHSLVPSKAPGNLGESAQCKKAVATAFGSVSMNFYAIAMPVQTPPNDDIIFGTSVEEEWAEFCRQTAFFPVEECNLIEQDEETEDGVRTYEPPPTLGDRAAKEVITESSETTTQSQAAQRLDEIVTGYNISSQESLDELKAQRNIDESAVFFDPLLTEMDQMNYYFLKIQEVLHSLHEEVENFPGKQSCVEINNKKECE